MTIMHFSSVISASQKSYALQIGEPGFNNLLLYRLDGNCQIVIYGIGSRKGQIWGHTVGVFQQINPSTNWIIPNSDVDAEDWQCRFTSITGNTANLSGNGAGGAWIDLSSADARLTLAVPPTGGNERIVNGTIEIRIGTGAVEASGEFELMSESGKKGTGA